jgi:hypothetical protein
MIQVVVLVFVKHVLVRVEAIAAYVVAEIVEDVVGAI